MGDMDRKKYYAQRPPPPPPAHFSQEPWPSIQGIMQERFYVKIFIIGLVLILIGYILATSIGYMVLADNIDSSTYTKIRTSLTTSGSLIKEIGMVCLVLGLFFGAVIEEKFPHYVRLGMFIALGLIVAFRI